MAVRSSTRLAVKRSRSDEISISPPAAAAPCMREAAEPAKRFRGETQTVPGLHVRYPYAKMLLTGEKSVETRGYSLPAHRINKTVALIETPGPDRTRPKARVVGTITFKAVKVYADKKAWAADTKNHRVLPSSSFGFLPFGWVVGKTVLFKEPVALVHKGGRGVIWASDCVIPK